MTKLSRSDVLEIQRLRKSGIKVKDIAKKFGIKKSTVDYWIYPNMRKRMIAYNTKCFQEKYKDSEEFRERHLKSVKKYQDKPEIMVWKMKWEKSYRKRMRKTKNEANKAR